MKRKYNDEIGGIKAIRTNKKEFPVGITIGLLLVAAVLFTYFWIVGHTAGAVTVAAVFVVCLAGIIFRQRCWTQYFFCERGIAGEKMCCGRKSVETTMYEDILEPKFNIVDNKVDGLHLNYNVTVDYGPLVFEYADDADGNFVSFNSVCSHTLYRYWTKHHTGKTKDYSEVSIICNNIAANKLMERDNTK